jgi:menaquinone-dependent protoporphyrinogen oxidase
MDASLMVERIAAREHRIFAGRLDRARLGFGERAITTMLNAPEGDFRSGDDIRAWAHHIADELGVEAGQSLAV